MLFKRKSGKSFKIPLIFIFAGFLALAYAFVNLIVMQVEIQQKRTEYEALSDKLYALNTQNELRERYTSDEYKMGYVEEIAREQLDYSYSDEKIYYFIPSN